MYLHKYLITLHLCNAEVEGKSDTDLLMAHNK